MEQDKYYCPICERDIEPTKVDGTDALLWIHDDIEHDESDFEAMDNGIQ